jgi:hypothetical protein
MGQEFTRRCDQSSEIGQKSVALQVKGRDLVLDEDKNLKI